MALPAGEEPSFENFYATIHPDDRERVKRTIEKSVKNREDYSEEYRIVQPDGSVRWIAAPGRCYVKPDGSLEGMGGITMDITARKADQEKLRELAKAMEEKVAERTAELKASRARLQETIEHAANGMCLTTPDGHFLEANPALCAFFGRDEAQILASSWQELTHPEDVEKGAEMAAQMKANKIQSFKLEKRYLRPDGSVVWGLFSCSCLRNEDGSINRLIAQIADITEERKAREALEAQKSRLGTVLDSLLDFHVLLKAKRDNEGKIADFIYVEANAAACRYNGLAKQQLLGRSLRETLPGVVETGLFERFCHVVEKGEPLVLDEFCYQHERQGQRRWFDMRGVRVDDALSLTGRDVTERRSVAEDLAASQARFRLLAENATDIVLETDKAGNITYISPSSAKTLGRAPAEIVGEPIRSLAHPDDRDALESLESQARKGTQANVELRLRSGDNGYEWFSLSTKPIFGGEGTVKGSVGGLRNIQREVQARDAVNAERHRLKITLDSLLDPHVLMQPERDENGRITDFTYLDANPAACEWLQIDRDSLLGRRLLELFIAVETTGLMEIYRDTAETGRETVIDNFPFPVGDGVRWLDIRGTRVDGRVSFVWRDVTERHAAADQIASSEEKYRLLALNASDVTGRADRNNKIVWVSPSLKRALGWEPEEWLGRSTFDVLDEGEWKQHYEEVNEQVRQGRSLVLRCRMLAKDGASHWVEMHLGPYRDQEGNIDGNIAAFRIIDKEVLAEQEVRHQQDIVANERKYLADAMEGSDAGTWEWYVQTGELVLNDVWAKLIGYSLDELLPTSIGTWEKFTHPEDLVRAKAELERCFRREVEIYECEARMRHRSGHWVWILTRGRVVEWTEDGKPLRMLGTHRDVTANVEMRHELAHQATTDSLTGLCNRRNFDDLAHRELSRARRSGGKVSVLMMDIDHFKSINDTRGHGAGDEVLKGMARSCAPHLRESDLLARRGGEEFAVLLPDTGIDAARAVAGRIREGLAASPVTTAGGDLSYTVSVGVAEFAAPETLDALLKRADNALYEAKNLGRNRVCG